MYYVYVLLSLKDQTTYIGYTAHLQKRIEEHNKGKTKSIKHKLPLKLIYFEAYIEKTTARKRELELKTQSIVKKKLYERLFNGPIV